MIRDLEEEWGIALLDRDRSGVRITSDGKKILEYPFLLSKTGNDSEVQRFLDYMWLRPNMVFTSWDDYVIMSMIEKGLGIGLMTSMILKRTPYRIVTRPLSVPAFRQIASIVRDNKRSSIAVKRFAEYVEEYRCRSEE